MKKTKKRRPVIVIDTYVIILFTYAGKVNVVDVMTQMVKSLSSFVVLVFLE